MAAAVVTVIVEDILQSLEEGMKLGQKWGVEHEIIEIQDSLSSIRGVLPEAEKKYVHSLELQDWVKQLKDVAFDVETLLEGLSVEEALWQRKRKVRRLFRAMDRLKFRRRMFYELLYASRMKRSLIRPDPFSLVRNIPDEIGEAHEEAPVVPLIGRDHEKRELMIYLLYGGMERDLPILTVRGGGGIGKTALVLEVLSESEVSRHFDDIIWVDASPPSDVNRIARNIIASLTNGVAIEEENVVEEQSLERVGKLLDGRKKYLFILDNLSVQHDERQRWLRFLSFLEGGDTGSKILVTTRDRNGIPYENSVLHLRGLTWEDSLDLLLKTASKGGVEEIIDHAKLQIAEEVAAKCGGNLFFIRAVGGYLSLQHDTRDWLYLRDKLRAWTEQLFSKLLFSGYPYGHLSPMVKNYNHLPPRIKRCFGFCSLFPRGHVIDRQNLAELWIAIGYIKSSNEDHRPLEDIADDYFKRLLMEELFQVNKFDTFGKERSVVLHPNAKDLARSVAGWECQAHGWNDYSWIGRECPRHTSIVDYEQVNWNYTGYVKLQTILHFLDDPSKCNLTKDDNISYLTHARVLDLHHMNIEAVPKAVWKLMHLRYLDLSDNRRIKTLPPGITGLLNLQTLKLSGCQALKELPQDMQKMVSLRHLYIDGCQKLCFMPKGLGYLKFLNILTDFILPPNNSSSVDSANLTDLCKLNNLRGSLRITNLGYSETARETFVIPGLLDKKSSLESLELIFMNLPTDKVALFENLQPHPNLKGLRIHNYGGVVLPEKMNRPVTYLPNLVEIALIGCENCKYLPQFGHMRHLKSLTIQELPNLLRMESGPELSSPDVANNAQPFAELSSLIIRDCPRLECLPLIPHLAKLTLVNVSEQLFGHPFWVASSLKTLRLEKIELLHHSSELWLRDPTSLEKLHIRNCPKLNFPSMMMPRLTKLTLANVGEELFKQPCRLPCLKTLRLENIELLDHLPEHLLRDLTCLEELDIGSCPSLVSLSRGMMHLENLQSLSIWNCKNLDMSKDEQDNIMTELQGLKSLKLLTIDKALKMEYLPDWLSRVYTLRFLCIRSCLNLAVLPEWLGNLRLLKLSIIGCPHLQSEGFEHSRRL